MKTLFLGIFLALVISASGVRADIETTSGLEAVTVKNISLEGDFLPPTAVLTLQVSSSGCTLPEHFRLLVTSVPNGKEITVIRVIPDRCRGFFPEGEEIQLSSNEIKLGDRVFVANPMRVDSTIPR